MRTSSFSRIATRLLQCLVIAGASAVAAECVFRLLGDSASADLEGLLIPFGHGGYRLRSQVDTTANWASGAFAVHTDDLGLRCDAARKFAIKAGDKVDYMFVGDSQGFGNGVNYRDTIAGAFASNLSSGVKIGNTSVGGHAALNQLELLRWLHDSQSIRVSTYVILLTPVMLTNPDSYTTGVVGPDGRLYNEQKSAIQRAIIWMKRNLVVYARLRDAVRNVGVGVTPSGETPLVFQVFSTVHDEAQAEDKLSAVLAKFVALGKEQGASVQLAYVPLTVEFDFANIQRGAERRGLSVDVNQPFAIASATARKLGLTLHDLRPTLKGLHDNGCSLNLKGDFHYAAAVSKACGNQLWAEIGEGTFKFDQNYANRRN